MRMWCVMWRDQVDLVCAGAMRAIPRHLPDLTFRAFKPDPELFLFLRGYARYVPRSISWALVSKLLSTAGPAWLQEVWVVKLTDLPSLVIRVLCTASRDTVVYLSHLPLKPCLWIFGDFPYPFDGRHKCGVRRVEGVAWAHQIIFRHHLTGAKHHCHLKFFARWQFLGP